MSQIDEKPELKKRAGKCHSLLNILRLTVFANLFITICSLIMSLYTSMIFSLAINIPLLLFTAFGTLSSYSFHWLLPSTHNVLSPREEWSRAHKTLLFIFFLIGAAGSFYSILSLTDHFTAIVPLIVLTFLYSSGKLPRGPFVLFRRYFIGKTIYLALMWTLITAYLPLAISNTLWSNAGTLFLINRFFFLFAICILFDLRDKELDTLEGIKSFITLLSRKNIKYLFYSSLIVSIITGLALNNFGFPLTPVSILLFPAILTVFLYNYSAKTRSELWFYFILDGLMMLSGCISILYSYFLK
ncbi:MAG: hypothetical protein ABI543_07490 [Ignavibacteria bacterium]